MTPETILSLLCKLTDTIDAQQRTIDALQAQVDQLTPEPEAPEWPTPTDT